MSILDWILGRGRPPVLRVEHDPQFRALLQEASSQLQKQNYALAKTPLLEALKSRDQISHAPTIEWLLNTLIFTWFKLDELDEGRDVLSQYISHHAGEKIALRARAMFNWYLDNNEEALRDYSEALRLAPGDPESLAGRGQVLVDLGEYGRALSDLDQALRAYAQTDPSTQIPIKEAEAYARNGRAAALAGLGRFDEALEEFRKSIALSPQNAWVYFNRARAYEAHGDPALAAADYRRALTLDKPKLSPPKAAQAQLKLANIV
jgi:tetratricopeptide (TPR) repeat protein